MTNQIINIAYALHDNSIFMLIVSLQSIIENNRNNDLHFYFIKTEFSTQKSEELIKNFAITNNCKITFVDANTKKFEKIKKYIIFCHNFYASDLCNLVNVDRILYINELTLINQDLSELYNTDLEGQPFASPEYLFPLHLKEKFNIDKKQAINDMIMLMDLKNWRENNLSDKIANLNLSKYTNINYINHKYAFNAAYNNHKILEIKYGYTEAGKTWGKGITISCSEKNKTQYQKIFMHIEKPIINIFVGAIPLNTINTGNSYESLWWKYAQQTEIYEEIKQFRNTNKYKLSTTSAQNSFKYGWLLSRIAPYIKPYWFRILLGFLIAIPLGLLDGVTAFALKPYMDYVVGGKALEFGFQGVEFSVSSLQMAYLIPIGVILFAIIQGVLRYLNGYFSTWVSQRITNDVKFDLFDRLIHMHPQFYDDNSSGIVISRYMSDPATASAGIVENLKTITTSLCGAFGLIAVMLYSSWKLAFIGVLVLCVSFVPVALIRNRIKAASNKNMVIGGNITTNINETYSGNKVMTAYGLQTRQNKYFQEQTWNAFNVNMSLYKRAGWMSPMMYLIASFGIATVLGVGTYLINSGQMTAGAFASFVTSLLLLYKPVKTLGNTLTGIQNIFVAMGRVFELFDLTPAITDCENPVEFSGLNNSIEFENVVFEYVSGKTVLNNLNLSVHKNETLAIVGNSGGGKSTLVSLIPRFYDIKSGSIKFDGVDIKQFSLNSLRENISMVFQDNFLFTGTIKENIMMGNPKATVEELMGAIKAAHLVDLIQELPDGLDTMLGERGLTLSGGQRQRVAIARAMLRNAPIVILDEATSALDNESEAIVQKAMDNLMKDRTVFIIAHRLSTIKNADRIAVINEGNLVELGSHDELMQIENGQYKALYEMQFKKQEV